MKYIQVVRTALPTRIAAVAAFFRSETPSGIKKYIRVNHNTTANIVLLFMNKEQRLHLRFLDAQKKYTTRTVA